MKVRLEFGFIKALDAHYAMKYVEPEALETFQKLSTDESILKHRTNLMDMFCNKQQCLVHNDYYPGSVMLNKLNIKVCEYIEWVSYVTPIFASDLPYILPFFLSA